MTIYIHSMRHNLYYIMIKTTILTLLVLLFTLLPTNTNTQGNIVQTLSVPPSPLSSTLLDIVKECENFSSTIYPCPAGYKTIGYGFRLSKKDTLTHITIEQANIILNKKLIDIKDKVQSRYNVGESQAEALTSLIYNIGWEKFLTSNFHKTLKSHGSQAIKEINFMSFCKAGGEVMRGLEIRREKEWELWNKR